MTITSANVALRAGVGVMMLIFGVSISAASDNASQVSHGRALYEAVGCYACHGRVGQGSIYSGPPLVPFRLPDEALASYVRAPGGTMPPFSSSILSDEALRAIAVYLRSLPEPRKASQTPLLAPYMATSGN